MGSGIAGRIENATYLEHPWPHIEIDGFLGISRSILHRWPDKGHKWLRHSDITKDDGTSLRRYWFLKDVFPYLAEDVLSGEVCEALKRKLGVDEALYPIALLVEDAPGYRIRTHTDCAGKRITCQIYLADDEASPQSGVTLQDRLGSQKKTVPYLFDMGYAFKVTNSSWHRVTQSQVTRRSLQLIYYDTPTPKI